MDKVNEQFINLIRVAEDDDAIRATLLSVLRLHPSRRIKAVEELLAKIETEGAPAELIEAITPLCEDQIAQKALEFLEHGENL